MNYEWRLLLICLTILGFPFLASSCAQTMRELENEALATGDWSKVEQREKRHAFDAALNSVSASCGDGTTLVCIDLPVRKDVRDIKWHCGCASWR